MKVLYVKGSKVTDRNFTGATKVIVPEIEDFSLAESYVIDCTVSELEIMLSNVKKPREQLAIIAALYEVTNDS